MHLVTWRSIFLMLLVAGVVVLWLLLTGVYEEGSDTPREPTRREFEIGGQFPGDVYQ